VVQKRNFSHGSSNVCLARSGHLGLFARGTSYVHDRERGERTTILIRLLITTASQYAICAPKYPHLRTLYVMLPWDSPNMGLSPFQVLPNSLPQLENLYIRLPSYEPASGVLSSHHPNLRTFIFSGKKLPPSFLKRHPTIELLRIEVPDGYILDDHDLPHLKVLRVDGMTVSNTPGLLSSGAQRPITHLRLDHVRTRDIYPLVRNAHATLRHLELKWSIKKFREHMSLFQHLFQLEELEITVYHSVWPSRQKDLVSSFFFTDPFLWLFDVKKR
jgi:hypothetical protein